MINTDVLKGENDTRFIFTQPYAFSSPSAAAAIVLDRNSNALSEWKVEGEKRTYSDVKDARVAGPVPLD